MRFRSKPLAALSIVLILAGTLGGWHAPDDRDEALPIGHHQHADHDARLSAAEQPTAPEQHCAFCHWLRAFGSGAPVSTQALAAESFQVLGSGTIVERVSTAALLALPSRAPPRA